MKVCLQHLGHMTKMAATFIYGKNHSKPSSPETLDLFPRNLVLIIDDSSPKNYGPWLTLTSFTGRSDFVAYAFLLEKVKTVDFSETIAACDLKVGRCRQLIEFMMVCEY